MSGFRIGLGFLLILVVLFALSKAVHDGKLGPEAPNRPSPAVSTK